MERLLLWDAPNMDMTLSTLIGGKPTPRQRPDLGGLYKWFVRRGDPGDTYEAGVFVNVPPHLAERMTGWVMWLNETGYRVFAKPKDGTSDIDEDIRGRLHATEPDELAEVLLASHDAKAFLEDCETLAAKGVQVTVLGFRELAPRFARSEMLTFIDLDEIPGLFDEPPPRVRLDALPPHGRWFEPPPEEPLIDDG
jgi:uncharacterized protein